MESARDPVQPPQSPDMPWRAAVKAAIFWILVGGAGSGLFALMDEFRLPQPFDNLAEALVVIVPLSLPVVAGVWHRSWRITVLLAVALMLVGLFFVGFTVMEMMLSGGRWAK